MHNWGIAQEREHGSSDSDSGASDPRRKSVSMSARERKRLEVLSQVQAGRLTLTGASELLGIGYRQVKRLSVVDFPTPVEPIDRIRIPKTFSGRNPQARRDLVSTMRASSSAFASSQ